MSMNFRVTHWKRNSDGFKTNVAFPDLLFCLSFKSPWGLYIEASLKEMLKHKFLEPPSPLMSGFRLIQRNTSVGLY